MAWLLRSGVYMCTDLYVCTSRINGGKKHHSRAAFQAGMKQWQSSVPWKYDKLKFIRRIKREASMYFQLMQSRLEPGTCALITEWFKHCLALEPHLVLFLFGYKTSAQKVRGMNTGKKKKKERRLWVSLWGCICNELMSYFLWLLSKAVWWHQPLAATLL